MGCCWPGLKSPNKIHNASLVNKKPIITSEQPLELKVPVVLKEPHWAYEGEYGPDNWFKLCPDAAGKHQSPVSIKTSLARFDPNLPNLEVKYDCNCFREIKNTGHTFMIISDTSSQQIVKGGPIGSLSYQFLQFHMHWGRNDSEGSEHLVDDESFAGEFHFVNWNNNRFSDPNDASKVNNHNGLMVLGVLIKIGKENDEVNKIIACIDDVKLKNSSTKFALKIDPMKLLPEDTENYWTYLGSLTTPPCTESVKWVVFKTPIEMSSNQMKEFRKLFSCSKVQECCNETRISYNFRPVCDLNERQISKSFQ